MAARDRASFIPVAVRQISAVLNRGRWPWSVRAPFVSSDSAFADGASLSSMPLERSKLVQSNHLDRMNWFAFGIVALVSLAVFWAAGLAHGAM
jgi:hypothetical protein